MVVVEAFAYEFVSSGLLLGRAGGQVTECVAAQTEEQLQKLVMQVQMQVRVVQAVRGEHPSMTTKEHGHG